MLIRYKKSKNILQKLMVSILILYCIFFPADKINIKEIILILTLIVCGNPIISELFYKKNVGLWFWGIVFPVMFIFLSIIIGESTIYGALSFGYVWFFLLLIPAIVNYEINVKDIFIVGTFIIASIINFVFWTDKLGLISIFNNPFIVFAKNMNEIQYGKGIVSTFGYSIFLKASPLMIFSFGYFVEQKKYLIALFYFMAFVGTGTRANFIVSILVAFAILLLCTKGFSKKIIATIIIILLALLFAPGIIERLHTLNEIKRARSDSVKLTEIKAVFRWMNARPWSYLFGTGVGSIFNSISYGYTDVVEVSYFDYFRQVGIVGFTLFCFFIINPMVRLFNSSQRWIVISLIGYLMIAFTNPLLVTSTSFIAYQMIYSCAFAEKNRSLL